MATNHRLFVETPLAPDQSIELPDDASHYLTRVLRLRPGATVTVFNGDGNNYTAQLASAEKKSARLDITTASSTVQDAPSLNLSVALLKGDKLDYALQKATELDVAQIWLTQTNRCELRMSEKRLANRMQHWRRIIVSACEQSGRTRLPTLHPPQKLNQVLEATCHMDRYSLDPQADAGALAVAERAVCLLTGPEGGYDDKEIDLLATHSTQVQLGPLILRAETAPLVGLALLAAARRAS